MFRLTSWIDKRELAGRGIRDFTENGGTKGAGCGGKIRWALVKGFVSENRESESFFGIGGNAEIGRGQHFNTGESGGELSHDQRIVRSSAGNDDLVDLRLGQDEAVEGVHDGKSGEDSGGPDEVSGFRTIPAAEGENFFDVGAAIIFAARALGRSASQIRVVHKFVDETGETAAARGEPSVFVKAFSAARKVKDKGVNEHVGWAGVEGEDLLWASGAGNDGDIGDAAEIERDAADFFVAVEQIIGVGNERSALTAEGDVGGPEVGDGGDAGARGDD